MSCKIPAAGAGISASTLSVEISNRGSSRCTLSPGFLSHLVIVPSKIDSPICGMTISVGIVPFHAVRRAKSGHAQPFIIYPDACLDLTRTYRGTNFPLILILIMVVVVVFPFRTSGRRRVSDRLLPIILHGGGQLFNAGEKRGHLPHFLFRQKFVP